MAVSFPPARPENCEILIELMREYYEYDRLPFNEVPARRALEMILGNESYGKVWLICRESNIIGYAVLALGFSLEYHSVDAFLDELYIQEAYRGQGIGKQAIQFIETSARLLGVQALHLEVERKNIPAQEFYRKEGYENHQRYLMTKWLDYHKNTRTHIESSRLIA
jgi:GNAT superfamily N-acetyltransferase